MHGNYETTLPERHRAQAKAAPPHRSNAAQSAPTTACSGKNAAKSRRRMPKVLG